MRMRAKKWARPELAACPYFIKEPAQNRGRWAEQFPKKQPLYMELGCGKGGFLAELASCRPEINFIGIDLISDVLAVARRNIQALYDRQGKTVDNVLLTSIEITRIELDFSEEDVVDRIYINFCNPWFKHSQHKKRLTHPYQLEKYRVFLKDGGEIWFKTDDDGLFADSVRYFKEMGFSILYQTQDLHQSGFSPNYLTEHEKMYTEQGIKKKFLIARKLSGTYRAARPVRGGTAG